MVKLVKPRAGPTADWCLDKSQSLREALLRMHVSKMILFDTYD